MSVRTGLHNLDAALSLMDRHVNIFGMEGSRMDWEDLMEWQRVLLGGDPDAEPVRPAPYRIADHDPQRGILPVWGVPPEDGE